MPNTFHQRCQLALTHPVTLGAVALLLVNDWLLKPLWQSDWTTGKLSDSRGWSSPRRCCSSCSR